MILIKLAETLKSMLLTAKQGDNFTTESLERAKKKKIGGFLRAVNSPEYIANQFTRYAFNEMNLFDIVPTLESITVDEIKDCRCRIYFRRSIYRMSSSSE